MKNICLILLGFVLVVQPLRAQSSGPPVSAIRDNSFSEAPLLLSINGGGKVVRFFDGDMLPVGRKFLMWAIPDPGYVFANWQPANVIIFTQYTTEANGHLVSTTSTVWIPIADYQRSSFLEFTVQPESVLLEVPGVETITQSQGWVANFAPVRR